MAFRIKAEHRVRTTCIQSQRQNNGHKQDMLDLRTSSCLFELNTESSVDVEYFSDMFESLSVGRVWTENMLMFECNSLYYLNSKR